QAGCATPQIQRLIARGTGHLSGAGRVDWSANRERDVTADAVGDGSLTGHRFDDGVVLPFSLAGLPSPQPFLRSHRFAARLQLGILNRVVVHTTFPLGFPL